MIEENGDTGGRAVSERRFVDIGRYITIFGAIVALLAFVFGEGSALQGVLAPRLEVARTQVAHDHSVISMCVLRNRGRTEATDVTVQFFTDPLVAFTSKPEVSGAEGRANLKEGDLGDSFALVEAPRLARSDSLTVTVSTGAQSAFRCEVDYEGGSVLPSESLFNLRPLDFLLITLIASLTFWITQRIGGASIPYREPIHPAEGHQDEE